MAVRLTYISMFSAVVMVVWYTTPLTKHSPFKGHLFGSLQLQGLGGVFPIYIHDSYTGMGVQLEL